MLPDYPFVDLYYMRSQCYRSVVHSFAPAAFLEERGNISSFIVAWYDA